MEIPEEMINLNLKRVKQHGMELGLEAELNAQQHQLIDAVKNKTWLKAASAAANCKAICDELHFITLGDGQPLCELTSTNETSKTSSKD